MGFGSTIEKIGNGVADAYNSATAGPQPYQAENLAAPVNPNMPNGTTAAWGGALLNLAGLLTGKGAAGNELLNLAQQQSHAFNTEQKDRQAKDQVAGAVQQQLNSKTGDRLSDAEELAIRQRSEVDPVGAQTLLTHFITQKRYDDNKSESDFWRALSATASGYNHQVSSLNTEASKKAQQAKAIEAETLKNPNAPQTIAIAALQEAMASPSGVNKDQYYNKSNRLALYEAALKKRGLPVDKKSLESYDAIAAPTVIDSPWYSLFGVADSIKRSDQVDRRPLTGPGAQSVIHGLNKASELSAKSIERQNQAEAVRQEGDNVLAAAYAKAAGKLPGGSPASKKSPASAPPPITATNAKGETVIWNGSQWVPSK